MGDRPGRNLDRSVRPKTGSVDSPRELAVVDPTYITDIPIQQHAPFSITMINNSRIVEARLVFKAVDAELAAGEFVRSLIRCADARRRLLENTPGVGVENGDVRIGDLELRAGMDLDT